MATKVARKKATKVKMFWTPSKMAKTKDAIQEGAYYLKKYADQPDIGYWSKTNLAKIIPLLRAAAQAFTPLETDDD